jgi:hypothetical protein
LAIDHPSNNVHKSLDESGQARSDFGAGLCFAAVLTAAPTRLLGLRLVRREFELIESNYKLLRILDNTVIVDSCPKSSITRLSMSWAYGVIQTYEKRMHHWVSG